MRSVKTAICCAVVSAALFGVLTALVATAWPPLAAADADLLSAFRDPASRHRWLVTASLAIGYALSPWTFRLAAVIGSLTLLAAERRRRQPVPGSGREAPRRAVLFMLVTVLGGGLISGTVKVVVGRARPGPSIALVDTAGASYPSGHALGVTVAVAVVLAMTMFATGRRPAPWLWAVGLPAVVAVGLSRMALGLHYPSDVLGGCLLGIAWASAAIATVLPSTAGPGDGFIAAPAVGGGAADLAVYHQTSPDAGGCAGCGAPP